MSGVAERILTLEHLSENARLVAARAVQVFIETIPSGCLVNIDEAELAQVSAKAVTVVMAEVDADIADAIRQSAPAS